MFDEEDTHKQDSSNYPTVDDSGYTPDEIEAIQKFKAELLKKEAKNSSVLRGLESAFWGITSYSLAKFLVLTSGSGGISLAVAATVLINNITNRDCLDGFRAESKEGNFEVEGMGNMVKFVFITAVSAVVLWSAVGDFLQLRNTSEKTYNNLQNTVEEFNRLPDKRQNEILIIGGIIIICGLWVVVDSKGRR
jgi:hypothetical protein